MLRRHDLADCPKTYKGLGVTRKTLPAIVNRHAGISPEMAMRLAKAFGGSVKSWLNMQRDYDLWQVKERPDLSGVRVLALETE